MDKFLDQLNSALAPFEALNFILPSRAKEKFAFFHDCLVKDVEALGRETAEKARAKAIKNILSDILANFGPEVFLLCSLVASRKQLKEFENDLAFLGSLDEWWRNAHHPVNLTKHSYTLFASCCKEHAILETTLQHALKVGQSRSKRPPRDGPDNDDEEDISHGPEQLEQPPKRHRIVVEADTPELIHQESEDWDALLVSTSTAESEKQTEREERDKAKRTRMFKGALYRVGHEVVQDIINSSKYFAFPVLTVPFGNSYSFLVLKINDETKRGVMSACRPLNAEEQDMEYWNLIPVRPEDHNV